MPATFYTTYKTNAGSALEWWRSSVGYLNRRQLGLQIFQLRCGKYSDFEQIESSRNLHENASAGPI